MHRSEPVLGSAPRPWQTATGARLLGQKRCIPGFFTSQPPGVGPLWLGIEARFEPACPERKKENDTVGGSRDSSDIFQKAKTREKACLAPQ